MSSDPLPINLQEHRAIIGLCVLAAFADGTQGEDERARIQQIASNFADAGLDVASVYQDVFSTMLQNGRSMQGRYSGDILDRSRQVNVSDLVHLTSQP